MAGDVSNRDSKRRRNGDVSTAETTSIDGISDGLNLLKGHPNPSLLPVKVLEKATQAVLSDHATAVKGLLYGPDPGFEPLRENIAAWLNGFYKSEVPTSSERICITGCASQNLGLMLAAYTDPEYTRNVWIVAPAYFLSLGFPEEEASELHHKYYTQYGLALRGLVRHHQIGMHRLLGVLTDMPKQYFGRCIGFR